MKLFGWVTWDGYWVGAAIAIFFVSFADEILTAQHVRADQELFAMGMGNLAAGVTQTFSGGASGSRTAVNDQMGGRTQLSGVWAAGAVAVVLLLLTEPMQYLPKATLGAVIVAAAIGLVDPSAWRFLARSSKGDVIIAVLTATGVVVVGVLQALVIAVLLSIVDVVRRSANPHDAVLGWVERLGRYADVSVHRRARTVPGVVVYRLERPPLLRECDLREGAEPRGGRRGARPGALGRVRCRGDHADGCDGGRCPR